MNSPEPISPSASTSSTDSPPPEDSNFQPTQTSGYLSNFTSHLSATFGRSGGGSSSSKRRLPAGGSFGAGSSDRDPKSRKKTGDSNRGGGQFDGPREPSMKKDKEELIDSSTVEWLRKEIGDPFQEQNTKF